MKTRARYIGLLLSIVLILLLAAPTSALAANPFLSRWTGTLDGTENTFDSPYCGDNNNYTVVTITPSVSGDYYYRDLSIHYDIDMQVDVYANSFDPLNPGTNYVDSADDFKSITLSAGTTYYVVVSGWCESSGSTSGTWDFVLSGPGSLGGNAPVSGHVGTFTGAEPTFLSPYTNSTNVYQVVGPLTPTASGSYFYRDLSIYFGVDMQVDLYAGPFDPANPTVNWLQGEDNSGYVTLTAGEVYYFVVSPLGGYTTTGTWEFCLIGPGTLVTPGASLSVPNLGLVQINASAPVQTYGGPAADMIDIVLPADADGNGFDTYVVTEVSMVDDEYWLGLFVGSYNYVYVPYSQVVPLTAIQGID